MNAAEAKPTKNQKRQEARDKARSMRDEHHKRNKRNKALIQGSVAVGVVAVIGVVAILIVSSLRPPGPGPANMLSDGIKIGAGVQAVQTAALEADALPVPSEPNADGVPAINVFLDFSCPACAQFEAVYGPVFRTWLENGTATVEYHPISFLDGQSSGTRFSTRAANASACVADTSPNAFFDFTQLVFENRAGNGEPRNLTNDDFVQIASASGADDLDGIAQCVEEETFANWVGQATARAMSTGPIPVKNSEVPLVRGTPTVLVNGKEYRPEVHGDLPSFVASLEESE